MVSSISAISSGSTAISGSSSTAITSDIKKKLQALGLDPSKYSTEAQAQAAITQAQAQQQPPQKPSGSKDDSIKTEVQDLASKMGITAASEDKISDILTKISDKISELRASAGTDPTKQAEADSYEYQYTTLSNDFSQKESSKSKLTGTLEGLANYNKASLALN